LTLANCRSELPRIAAVNCLPVLSDDSVVISWSVERRIESMPDGIQKFDRDNVPIAAAKKQRQSVLRILR